MKGLKLDGAIYRLRWQHQSPGMHCLVALSPNDGSQMAHISWEESTGVIMGVHVHPKLRRRGVATTLLRLAREREPFVRHSRFRTPEGEHWARSLGEPLPERITW